MANKFLGFDVRINVNPEDTTASYVFENANSMPPVLLVAMQTNTRVEWTSKYAI